MLTSVIASFCNTFLGRFIENLDTDQLYFSLLQGEVLIIMEEITIQNNISWLLIIITGKAELRNVSLKKNALANLGLPFAIHSGFVGKVCIDIPVIQMTSRPWLISFDQLYLVAGPKNKDEVHISSFNIVHHS